MKLAHGAEDLGLEGAVCLGAAHREGALAQGKSGPVVAGVVIGPGRLMDGLGEQGLVLPCLGRGQERLEDLQRLRVRTTVEEALGLGQPIPHGIGRRACGWCGLRRGGRLRGQAEGEHEQEAHGLFTPDTVARSSQAVNETVRRSSAEPPRVAGHGQNVVPMANLKAWAGWNESRLGLIA